MTGLRKRLVTAAALSALFLVVYGVCGWATRLRGGAGSVVFGWERHIPFVPLLIVPYMSIDLFFVAAPFVTRSDAELRTLARRITAAIFIAGVCFLLWPLRFSFARPPMHGIYGLVFAQVSTIDWPFNECPSLHIALLAILTPVYWRRTRGVLRAAVAIWFALIAISPVLTYQHHMIDVFGGSLLAVVCFHFIAERRLRQPFVPAPGIAALYLAAAATWAMGAMLALPWTLALGWPAASCLLMAAAYLWLGPGIYRKHDGRLPWTTWTLLGPVVLAQWLSWRYYARECRAIDRITERLWIGRRLTPREMRRAVAIGVTAAIDLSAEMTEPTWPQEVTYLHLPVLDLTAPTPAQIDAALALIAAHADRGVVYVHCKAGYSRTAVIAGAWLLDSGEAADVEAAVHALRRVRPTIVIRPEARQALECCAERAISTPPPSAAALP